MSPTAVGYLGCAVLLVVLFSRLPIGAGMALVGFSGFAVLKGWDPALGLLKQVPYTMFAQQGMSVVPLFILMGAFAFEAGLSADLYRGVNSWFGHLRGGLAIATIGACAFFSAICGSSVATAATMATVAMPEMKKYKYEPSLALGSIAAGGTMGILIPPSIIMIIYGIIAEQSIGKLFLAGFLPGVSQAVFYVITVLLLTRINPKLGPQGAKTTLREKVEGLFKVWEVLVLFVFVIGGIYVGMFTPTEAAGVGAFLALLFALLRRRLTWSTFSGSLVSTMKNTGMIFIILVGAMILGYFLSVSRLPFEMAGSVAGLPINPYVILILILAVMLLLGCIMDSMAIVLLTVPIFLPVILKLGFDPIWFGILTVRVTEMGLITPPVGLNIFIIKGMSQAPMGTVYKGVLPFIVADFCHLAVLIAFPQISLLLPDMM
ncbi:MAG: TRAP transporter large permease [Desulfobacteraceae bacterium]|nr:MAG: TRAP transporter large permease [Desulfobacteraceae bacterium]